jgi:hypothetical protein
VQRNNPDITVQSQIQLATHIVKIVIKNYLVDEEIRFTFVNRIADSDLAVATTFLRDISLKRFGHGDSVY